MPTARLPQNQRNELEKYQTSIDSQEQKPAAKDASQGGCETQKPQGRSEDKSSKFNSKNQNALKTISPKHQHGSIIQEKPQVPRQNRKIKEMPHQLIGSPYTLASPHNNMWHQTQTPRQMANQRMTTRRPSSHYASSPKNTDREITKPEKSARNKLLYGPYPNDGLPAEANRPIYIYASMNKPLHEYWSSMHGGPYQRTT